jgi:hypothetical protein
MTTTFPIDELPAESTPGAVIMALARETDTDPLEIPPLGNSLNPTALDLLLRDDCFTGHITFEHSGYEISVFSDGFIKVTE